MVKELGGWGKKGNRIPETVFDEKGKEREGEERLEAWKEAFRKLGEDDLDDPDFDKEFALSVEAEVIKMEKRVKKRRRRKKMRMKTSAKKERKMTKGREKKKEGRKKKEQEGN